jgi:hypothetical protein
MNINWSCSSHPATVVGTAPDGGFVIHASHHPLGVQGALDSARRDGVAGHERDGEIYFPLPWIRSELARMLKQDGNGFTNICLASIRSALDITLPSLQNHTKVDRYHS